MFDQLLSLLGFLILGYASYTDWKTYEVPDGVSYTLIGSALVLRGVWAFQESNVALFLAGFFGFLLMVVIGCLFYYTAQWGGADAKLLMGLGALFGIERSSDALLVSFGVNLLLFGGLYGLCYMMVLGARHFTSVRKRMKQLQRTKTVLLGKQVSIAGAVISGVFAFQGEGLGQAMLVSAAIMFPVSYYLWLATKAVEEMVLIKVVRPSQLTEGDWLVKEVRHQGKLVCAAKNSGVTKEQMDLLRSLEKKGVIKEVTMKQGIPFIPAFLLAYVATVTIGNIVLWTLL